MTNIFDKMDNDWNGMLNAMRATGANIKEGQIDIEPFEVFGLSGQEEILANLEAQQSDLKIQQENSEINMDNRIFDAQQ